MDDLASQDREREDQIASTVRTLKTIADVNTGRIEPSRVAARLVVQGIRAIKENDKTEKTASSLSSPIAIAAWVEKKAGSGWVEFEYESLRDLGLSDPQVRKALAAKVALYEPKAFSDWGYFHRLAKAFNGYDTEGDFLYDLSLAEVAWAVDIMRYLDTLTPWGEEVCGYIAAIAHDEGFVTLPGILNFASERLAFLLSDVGQVVAARIKRGVRDESTKVQIDKIKALQSFVNNKHRELGGQLEGVK